ncbi:MAG: type II toxin-antitoxin system RelE/ParE family toxin [Candidatus Babeliales bacterium]
MVHPPCIGYTIFFTDDAKKDLRKLEKQIISRIFEKVKELTSNKSDNLNIKKLKSKDPLYRVRMGDYRIIYCIKHAKIIVYVVAIGHRKDIYSNLDRRLIKTN